MADIQLNGASLVTTSATTAPASGTSEAWSVTALSSLFPGLIGARTYTLVDATSGATSSQQAEIIRVTACTGSGATSITVTRGADGTTPVAHANPSTFNVIMAGNSYNTANNGAPSYLYDNTGALASKYDIGYGFYNYKGSNTRVLDQGRADAMTGGMTTHLWIGDSVSAGCTSGIGTISYDRLHAPALCMRDQLANNGIRANGTGHIRINDAQQFDARWITVAPTGTWLATSNIYSQASTVNATITLVVDRPGSIYELAYVDFGGATVTVSIDGATSGANFGTFSTTAGSGTTAKLFRMTGCTVNIGSVIKHTVTVIGTGFKIMSGGTWYPNGGLIMHNISMSGSGAFTDGAGATSGSKVWSDLTAGTGGSGAYWFSLFKQRRTITDAATTAASTTLTSATAAFTVNDQGKPIDQFPDATGALFPPNTVMVTRLSATTMTMSNAALVTATGKTLNLGRDPECIHVALGGNDTMAGVATPAQISTALQTIRNQFPNSDCILHLENEPSPTLATAVEEAAFQLMIGQTADTLDVPMYDWRDRAGNYSTAFNNGIMQDYQAHMIPGMYADLGGALAQRMGGGSGPPQNYTTPFYAGDLLNKEYGDATYLEPTVVMAPAAAWETFPRLWTPSVGNQAVLTSGTLYLVPVTLPKNMAVGHITFLSQTTAATSPTHWWFGLYDSNRNQLAMTADQTSTAWAATTTKTLAIASTAYGPSSTSFTTGYNGRYYVGIMMAASVVISLKGIAAPDATLAALGTALLCGNSDTAQTTVPAMPHAATAPAAATAIPYALVAA